MKAVGIFIMGDIMMKLIEFIICNLIVPSKALILGGIFLTWSTDIDGRRLGKCQDVFVWVLLDSSTEDCALFIS